MFGLFKKKKSAKDMQFEADLASFVSDFKHIMDASDPEGTGELMSRAYNNYYKRDPEEADFSASDHYLDAFTGAIFELMDRAVLPPMPSFQLFSMIDQFLRGNPKYETDLSGFLMHVWQSKLIKLGAIQE